jgi:hypothetical protein
MNSRTERYAERIREDLERERDRDRGGRRSVARHPVGLTPDLQPTDDPIGFDPYMVTKWRVVAGEDPGYLPTTPMRLGAVGFYVSCWACGVEFESKGLAYCGACMELPAEERRAMKPTVTGRMCEGPGCENRIPRLARRGVRFCSEACRGRAARLRKRRAESGEAI